MNKGSWLFLNLLVLWGLSVARAEEQSARLRVPLSSGLKSVKPEGRGIESPGSVTRERPSTASARETALQLIEQVLASDGGRKAFQDSGIIWRLATREPGLALELSGRIGEIGEPAGSRTLSLISQLALSSPQLAIEEADRFLAGRGGVSTDELAPEIFETLAVLGHPKARDFLEPAKAAMARKPKRMELLGSIYWMKLAMGAARLGEPDAEVRVLVDESLKELKSDIKPASDWLSVELIGETAPVSVSLTRELIAETPEARRIAALSKAIPGVAAHDIPAALVLYDDLAEAVAHPPYVTIRPEAPLLRAAEVLIPLIGKNDPATALKLARSIKGRGREKPLALMQAARWQSPEEAVALLREAYGEVNVFNGGPVARARIAAELALRDEKAGLEMFDEILASDNTRGNVTIAAVAAYLSAFDAVRSRALLEKEWGGLHGQPGHSVEGRLALAKAMALVEPARAIEMTAAFTGSGNGKMPKARALLEIAQLLLEPPSPGGLDEPLR